MQRWLKKTEDQFSENSFAEKMTPTHNWKKDTAASHSFRRERIAASNPLSNKRKVDVGPFLVNKLFLKWNNSKPLRIRKHLW